MYSFQESRLLYSNNRWQRTVFNLITQPELPSPILWSRKAEEMLVSAFDHQEDESSLQGWLSLRDPGNQWSDQDFLVDSFFPSESYHGDILHSQSLQRHRWSGCLGNGNVADCHSESRINPGPLQTTKYPHSFLLTLGKGNESSAKITTDLPVVLLEYSICSKGSQSVGCYPFGNHITSWVSDIYIVLLTVATLWLWGSNGMILWWGWESLHNTRGCISSIRKVEKCLESICVILRSAI